MNDEEYRSWVKNSYPELWGWWGKEIPSVSNHPGFAASLARADSTSFRQEALEELRKALFTRLMPDEEVGVVGPTAGGELLAAHLAKTKPVLCTPVPSLASFVEDRMLQERAPYSVHRPNATTLFDERWRCVVLTPWIENPRPVITNSIGLIRTVGFLILPRTIQVYRVEDEHPLVLTQTLERYLVYTQLPIGG